jgi:hypothetical protein
LLVNALPRNVATSPGEKRSDVRSPGAHADVTHWFLDDLVIVIVIVIIEERLQEQSGVCLPLVGLNHFFNELLRRSSLSNPRRRVHVARGVFS